MLLEPIFFFFNSRLKSSHTDNTPKVISPSTDTKLGQLNNPPENVANKKNALTNLESNVQTTEKKLTDYFPIRRSIRKTKKTVLEERQRNIEEAIKAEVEEGLEVIFTSSKFAFPKFLFSKVKH